MTVYLGPHSRRAVFLLDPTAFVFSNLAKGDHTSTAAGPAVTKSQTKCKILTQIADSDRTTEQFHAGVYRYIYTHRGCTLHKTRKCVLSFAEKCEIETFATNTTQAGWGSLFILDGSARIISCVTHSCWRQNSSFQDNDLRRNEFFETLFLFSVLSDTLNRRNMDCTTHLQTYLYKHNNRTKTRATVSLRRSFTAPKDQNINMPVTGGQCILKFKITHW